MLPPENEKVIHDPKKVDSMIMNKLEITVPSPKRSNLSPNSYTTLHNN